MEDEIKVKPKKINELEAYQLYLDMGVDRSLEKLVQTYSSTIPSINISNLKYWCRVKGWVSKADDFDKREHDEVFKIALKKSVKSKVNILTLCQTVLSRFGQELVGEKVIIKRKDVNGNDIEEIRMNRYHPDMSDVERAYKIIKQELGEGLSEWDNTKEINLTAVFQQIFKNAETEEREKAEVKKDEQITEKDESIN